MTKQTAGPVSSSLWDERRLEATHDMIKAQIKAGDLLGERLVDAIFGGDSRLREDWENHPGEMSVITAMFNRSVLDYGLDNMGFAISRTVRKRAPEGVIFRAFDIEFRRKKFRRELQTLIPEFSTRGGQKLEAQDLSPWEENAASFCRWLKLMPAYIPPRALSLEFKREKEKELTEKLRAEGHKRKPVFAWEVEHDSWSLTATSPALFKTEAKEKRIEAKTRMSRLTKEEKKQIHRRAIPWWEMHEVPLSLPLPPALPIPAPNASNFQGNTAEAAMGKLWRKVDTHLGSREAWPFLAVLQEVRAPVLVW